MQKFLSSTIQVAAALIPLAGCFLGLPTLAQGEKIYSDKDGTVFVDTASIEGQASVRNFTTSKVYSKPKQFPGIKDKVYKLKNEQAVDCKAKNLRSISTTFYDRNNKNLKNNPGDKKFKPVPKGGNDEKVVNFVCKKNIPLPGKSPDQPAPNERELNDEEWKKRKNQFLGTFKNEAEKLGNKAAKEYLMKKVSDKSPNGGERKLIRAGQSTCAFVKGGRVLSELSKKRDEQVAKEKNPAKRTLLKLEYNIVNKSAPKLCPELTHLLEL